MPGRKQFLSEQESRKLKVAGSVCGMSVSRRSTVSLLELNLMLLPPLSTHTHTHTHTQLTHEPISPHHLKNHSHKLPTQMSLYYLCCQVSNGPPCTDSHVHHTSSERHTPRPHNSARQTNYGSLRLHTYHPDSNLSLAGNREVDFSRLLSKRHTMEIDATQLLDLPLVKRRLQDTATKSEYSLLPGNRMPNHLAVFIKNQTTLDTSNLQTSSYYYQLCMQTIFMTRVLNPIISQAKQNLNYRISSRYLNIRN